MLFNDARQTAQKTQGHWDDTWHIDRINSSVITLDEPSKDAIEDGTQIQHIVSEAVRRLNVSKVEITYIEREAELLITQCRRTL